MESDTSPIIRDEYVDEIDEDKVQEDCCSTNIACDPRRRVHRYFVLFVMCFLGFGSYFCYDNPAAMEDIMIKELNITSTQYMAFYSWYSWPQVVLSFAGGFLIDRVFGIRLGAIVFASFTTAGQLIFALGSYIDKIWLMDLARFVYGIGGESLAVAQNTYAASWFRPDELNMVFGLQLSMSRVGSTVNMNTMQPIYRSTPSDLPGYKRLGISLFIAATTCFFSLSLTFVMAFLDKRANKFTDEMKPADDAPQMSFKDIRYFPLSFWLIALICVAYYVTVFPYISLGLVFYERKYGLDPTSANAVNSITYILSAAISPVSGFLIDRTGKNIFWILLGIGLTTLCHAGAAFTFFVPPVAIAVVMGIGYSILASALWPMVAIIIPRHMLGTAYGIMQAIQNFGLAVIALVAGILVDKKGYLILEVFFLMWLCAALISASLLYMYDATIGKGALNLSAAERKAQIMKAREEAAAKENQRKEINDPTPVMT